MLATHTISLPSSSSAPTNTHGVTTTTAKRKRKPAGTPDPDAEVVYLSPETLMESDRYVCEVCNLSFQREQNLQMHRRRHKLPKRVYVCPEPSCVHHDPAHALGDLVGIKKHFRRKHSNHKQWVCERCSKGYAVHSDYKAHLKTCGTRGHSCDCGRVFSRVETFIEHQDSCKARRKEIGGDRLQTPLKSAAAIDDDDEEDHNTLLRRALRLRSETKEVMKVAMEQKAKAAEKRKQARVLMEMANQEMEKAKKIREQAFVTEIRNSQLQKDRLTWQMLIGSSSGGQHRITCDSCKMNRSKAFFQESAVNYYFPSAITHGENGDNNNNSLMFRPLRPA
nr:protein SHOOT GRAVITROPISM 5-like [Ipomoea batatas]